jgi:hypothetical protein
MTADARRFSLHTRLALEVGTQRIIYSFENGQKIPIIVWEAHDQKKPPDGEQRAGILGMLA